jgi:DNA-binding XRE family transcriptional regulator/tetratricopeptide (TPR) repeat protein
VIAKRHALAARRQSVGHTQETLAEFVGVEPTTVGRWERGETCPQPWCRPKLAQGLSVSVEELDSMLAGGQPAKAAPTVAVAGEASNDPERDLVLSAPWNHRGTVESAVVLRGGDQPVKRRGFVFLSSLALTAPAHQWLIHEPGPVVSGLSGRRVSATLADRFMAMIPELRAMDDVAGGGTVLPLAQQQFGMIAELLDRASYDEPTGRKFFVALAELGQLAGWTAYDAGQRSLAQRYYVAGLRAAHSADDRPLGAHILGSMAYQAAREGHPREAVTLIDTAVAGVYGWGNPRLSAMLNSHRAYAFAILRDSSGCTTAISNSRDQVEFIKPDDYLPCLYWIGRADVTAWAGLCLLTLGEADQAAALLEEGIALLDKSFVRDRQNYLIRHAEALAHPGPQQDLEAAVECGRAALVLSGNLDSTQSINRVRDLVDQMRPHSKVPAVRDFVESTRALVAV